MKKIYNLKFSSIFSGVPYTLLMALVSIFFLMVFSQNNAGIIDMTQGFLSAGKHIVFNPYETFFTHRTYLWALPDQARFIEERVPDNGKVLFVNDQKALSQNFVYYNIYTYSDKKIKYFFDGKQGETEDEIIQKMKESKVGYIYSYQNEDPVYACAKNLKGKSFLLRLINGKLEVFAVND